VTAPETREDLRVQLAEQKRAVDALNRQLAEQKRTSDSLAQQVVDLQKKAAAVVPAVPATPAKPGREIFAGSAGAVSRFGDWKLSESSATQQDTSLLFAKASIPLRQDASEILYEFAATGKGPGWIGYGLHLSASGDATGQGYGFGNSLLVWLTRDSSYYKTGTTYVQLYRSYDDLRMIQIASVGIADSISSELRTSVLYNQMGGTVVVAVNGVERLQYKLTEALPAGTRSRCEP